MISARSARAVTAAAILLLMAAGAGCTPARRDGGSAQMPSPPSPVATAAPTEPPPVAPTGALLVFDLEHYSPTRFAGPGPAKAWYMLQPVAPATGEKDVGYEPLDMGRYLFPFLAASPDGRMLAALTTVDPADLGFPAYSYPSYRKLSLFRLDTWDEIRGPDIQPSWFGHLLWNPGGTRLYMFGNGGAGGVSHLWIVDLQGAEPRLQAEAEIPFVVESARTSIAPDGNTLYILGLHVDDPYGESITVGSPFLAAIDAATGRERARLELPGVKVGQYLEPDERVDRFDIRGRSYDPGLAMSPDGRRYYVAHPDENAITVVNLETMAVERTVNPAREASLWERLRASLENPARAKGFLAGPSKDLLVSPDGRWLYALGTDIQVVPVGEGLFGLETKVTGVQVIDTETMKEVTRLAAGEAWDAVLSPDGRHLYVIGLEPPSADPDGGQGVREGIGLMVYETGTWKPVSHLTPGANYRTPVPSSDGRFVYLFDSVRPEGAAENETRIRLTVVTTGDWTIRSQRITEDYPYCIMAGPGRCSPW